ncbi:hypothetical protein SteCoe_2580 [Stentor coeruleus]|uniref:Uncharacterized protein n=1 Tax=Stentor coeruleus TaxID=5963 RepID=A0A1R2CZ28_9CILI|nr:hypothetical protein SteCoe_2580 [Stentor coeruleus]
MLLHFISLFLLSTCLILTLYSLLGSPWTSFEVNSLEFTHNLLFSLNSPDLYKYADYQCLKEISCPLSKDSDLCKISSKLVTAKKICLTFEIISIFTMIMLLERLILKIVNKPYGSPNFFLFLMWVLPILKSVGITSFIIISNVNMTQNSKSDEINSKYGIYLSLTSLALSIASAVCMIIGKVHKSKHVIKFKIITSTGRFVNPLLMLIVTEVLFILSKVYPTASFNGFSEITINIYYVNKMSNYNNFSIPCVTGQECLVSQDECDIFHSLDSVGDIVFYLEAIGYLFVFLWLEASLNLLFKLRLGTNFLNYMYPLAYLVSLLASLIYYAVKSKVSYGAQCNIEDFNNDYVLCAEIGTTFYIISIVFATLTMITYQLMYAIFAVGSNADKKVITDISDFKMSKNNNDEIHVQNIEKVAEKTSNEPKSIIGVLTTGPSMKNKFCEACKKDFKPSETGITDKGKKYHYKCYVISDN